MKYCPTKTCWTYGGRDNETFCEECGSELIPFLHCLCGEATFNPKQFPSSKRLNLPRFCPHCGQELTEDYLARCMSAQLKGMVREIVAKWDSSVV